MKIALFFSFFLLPLSAWSITAAEMSKISEQFFNRGWQHEAVLYMRHAHMSNYSNSDYLQKAQELISSYTVQLGTLSDEQASLFYPQAKLESVGQRIVLKDSLQNVALSYKTLQGWTDFITAVNTDLWADGEDCEVNNPMVTDCGRETRGNFAITQLTDYQRQNLGKFKTIILGELDIVKSAAPGMPIGPGPARVFQFLYDSRAINKLIQQAYVRYDDPDDANVRRTNIVDVARAIIIQIYKEPNGTMTTSDNREIELDSPACLEKQGDLRSICQLEYTRALVWDKDFSSTEAVTNLVLDRKAIRPFFDALIATFTEQNPESVSREQLIEFIERTYFTLCLAYDLDPSPGHLILLADFVDRLDDQARYGIEYLIYRRNIVGLHVARGLQELIPFVREETL